MTLQIKEGSTSRNATSDELAQIVSDLGAAPSSHTHQAIDISGLTEAVQDIIGAMVVAAGGTYNDAAGTITLPAGSGGSITVDTSVIDGSTNPVSGNAVFDALATKATPLAPVAINAATVLTYADHANRQLRFSGVNTAFMIPTDAGSNDDSWEIVTSAGSPGVPTLNTPDGKSIVGAIGKTIGAVRKGTNSYDVGTTDSTPPASLTGTEIVAAIDTNQGGTAWRLPMTGAAIVAAITSYLGSSDWQGGGAGSPATVLSAVVENSSPSVMTLTMSQALTSADPAGAGGITLSSTGSAITVTAVDVSGTSVVLTLSRPVVFGETITRSYASGSSSVPFANANGNVANFTGAAVTNNVAGTAPVFTSLSVENVAPNVLVLTSNVALTSADPTGSGGMVLTASGGAVSITGVDVSGTTTLCSLSRSIANGESMTLAYTSGSSSAPFASAGGSMANFSGTVVTNNVASGGGGVAFDLRFGTNTGDNFGLSSRHGSQASPSTPAFGEPNTVTFNVNNDMLVLRAATGSAGLGTSVTVTSAQLYIYGETYLMGNPNYEVYRCLREWVPNEMSFNEFASGQAWGTAGGRNVSDRGASPIGTLTPGSAGAAIINLDAAAVQSMINAGGDIEMIMTTDGSKYADMGATGTGRTDGQRLALRIVGTHA